MWSIKQRLILSAKSHLALLDRAETLTVVEHVDDACLLRLSGVWLRRCEWDVVEEKVKNLTRVQATSAATARSQLSRSENSVLHFSTGNAHFSIYASVSLWPARS